VARRGPPQPEPEEEEEQEPQGEWAEVLYDFASDVCPLFYVPSHHDFTCFFRNWET